MKLANFTEIHNNSKSVAEIVPITADLPAWKHCTAQPLVRYVESVRRMIK